MDPVTADLFFTLLTSTSLMAASGVALSLLPWTPLELEATTQAFKKIGNHVLHQTQYFARLVTEN